MSLATRSSEASQVAVARFSSLASPYTFDCAITFTSIAFGTIL